MGGFTIVRHNEVRDLTAKLMSEVCHDVCIEPTCSQSPVKNSPVLRLLPRTVPGLMLLLTIFGGVVLNVPSFFNPHAPSNRQPLSSCYRKYEYIKKRAYEQRVWEVEHSTFTPLVMSLTGGLGNAATICYKRLASLLSSKRERGLDQMQPVILSSSLVNPVHKRCPLCWRVCIQQLIPPTDLVSTEAKISSPFYLFSLFFFRTLCCLIPSVPVEPVYLYLPQSLTGNLPAYICSMQSRNLHNLEIVLRGLEIACQSWEH